MLVGDRRLTLVHGDLRLELAPELGGAVARFLWSDRDVLRPMPPGATDVLDAACFPLVPYNNRIKGGVFEFEGREVRLRLNHGGHPHALHGHGWQAPWITGAVGPDRAELSYRHEADDWPWSYLAEQTISLQGDALQVEIAVTNTSAAPMPAGLGFHPYYASAGTRLKAEIEGVWLIDEDAYPTEYVQGEPLAHWCAGDAVQRPHLIDHCFTGWNGHALIELPSTGVRVEMTASPGMKWMQVYSPPGGDLCAIEPNGNAPGALNSPHPAAEGIHVLAPGERYSEWMRLRPSAL